jgi:hypothetical protein
MCPVCKTTQSYREFVEGRDRCQKETCNKYKYQRPIVWVSAPALCLCQSFTGMLSLSCARLLATTAVVAGYAQSHTHSLLSLVVRNITHPRWCC